MCSGCSKRSQVVNATAEPGVYRDRVTVHLIVGLPGAGKTTRAKELETARSALRLTPDEWQMAIFHDDEPTSWRTARRVEQRERIEGKLIEIGIRAARLGVEVILDFGLWSKEERSALRWIAGRVGVDCEVVYLPIDLDEQRSRIDRRYTTQDGQFLMTHQELEEWHGRFDVPDDDELRGGPIPPAPEGFRTWSAWAADRWPTLSDAY